jgi:pantothenate kinase-related protein Tda10
MPLSAENPKIFKNEVQVVLPTFDIVKFDGTSDQLLLTLPL